MSEVGVRRSAIRQSISRWYEGVKARWHFRAALGNGLSEVDAFYNPKRRHAIELKQEEILRREEDDDGDGGPKSPARKTRR